MSNQECQNTTPVTFDFTHSVAALTECARNGVRYTPDKERDNESDITDLP